MIPTNLNKIKTAAQEFFRRMDLGIEVDIKPPQDLTIPIDLKVDEPQILIGEGGQTLAEVQRLLKIILRKKVSQEPFYINIDINEYKKKKAEYLKEMARTTADEVVLIKKEKYLPPMPAFERRVIHLELADRADVVTESLGQGSQRYIAIKLAIDKNNEKV